MAALTPQNEPKVAEYAGGMLSDGCHVVVSKNSNLLPTGDIAVF